MGLSINEKAPLTHTRMYTWYTHTGCRRTSYDSQHTHRQEEGGERVYLLVCNAVRVNVGGGDGEYAMGATVYTHTHPPQLIVTFFLMKSTPHTFK